MAAGGERFEYISALNARADHARALAQLILRTCSGWPLA
jgi:ferrochelatase